MPSTFGRRTLLASVALSVAAAGLVIAGPADAAVPRVTNVTVSAQDFYHAKLQVHWHKVAGATYKVRYGGTKNLGHARVTAVRGTYLWIGPLNRGGTTYVQVRTFMGKHYSGWTTPRALHFTKGAPATPVASATAIDSGHLLVKWNYSPYATEYQVTSAPLPGTQWPDKADIKVSPWLPQTARSYVVTVPTDAATDTSMTALPYGNPVFVQVRARDAYRSGAGPTSRWLRTFPKLPTPAAGTPLRFGTYNLMQGGTSQDPKRPSGTAPWLSRAATIAKNILARRLTMVAVQEVNIDSPGRMGVDDLIADLNATAGRGVWAKAPTPVNSHGYEEGDGRIIYNTSQFALRPQGGDSGSGVLTSTNPTTGNVVLDGWARFVPTSAPGSRPFLIASIHFTVSTSTDIPQADSETGDQAAQIAAALGRLQPAGAGTPEIIAGDFSSGYGLAGNRSVGQAYLVRHGFYDAMAAQQQVGIDYQTVNKLSVPQKPYLANKVGTRADGIFMLGIKGSSYYENVVNYPAGGPQVSDHNLVYATIQVPAS